MQEERSNKKGEEEGRRKNRKKCEGRRKMSRGKERKK